MWKEPVLVRGGQATTYHFGIETPICEKQPSPGEAEPKVMTLKKAVKGQKRLCQLCAGYVGDWAQVALFTASEKGLVNPTR